MSVKEVMITVLPTMGERRHENPAVRITAVVKVKIIIEWVS